MNPTEEKTLFNTMQQNLYTGVICDVLDDLGYRNQAMNARIRPLENDSILVGRAKTILAADIYHIGDNPYELEIKSIDSLTLNEVVVFSTNESTRNGPWGELLSTAAKMRGARGAIIDGVIRDSRKIKELGFPVFCTGFKPVDSKGRGVVIGYDCPIEAGGVLVHPGDVIFADFDGVVVIPSAVLHQTVEAALLKVDSENKTRDELLQGRSLQDVFDKYGVL